MPNSYFQFKQFTVHHDRCAMKVTTDACLFGAWCAAALSKIATGHSNALDIGTGTGLLSLMVAQSAPLRIDAVEIDEQAAGQAGENFASSLFGARIHPIQSDVLHLTNEYDYILSNPPFYENELRSGKEQKDTAHHSSKLSLEQLLSFTEQHLAAEGKVFLLLPYKRRQEILDKFSASTLSVQEIVTVKPSCRHQAFRVMLQAGFEKMPVKNYEMAIRDEGGAYTPEFSDLLRPYYLYLGDT